VSLEFLFCQDYHNARQNFLAASSSVNATIQSFQHQQFPELFCDVSILKQSSQQALITISGTHGVEGFCGSAIQTNLLKQQHNLQPELFQVHIHSINPWGMQYLSRSNEDNIDLNRNCLDFSQPLPVNPFYQLIHPLIDVPVWEQPQQEQFWTFYESFVSKYSLAAWNQAFSGGQYDYPNGVMFGGLSPSWSHQILDQIINSLPDSLNCIVVIDFHSGVGRFASELIFVVHKTQNTIEKLEKIKKDKILIYPHNDLPINTDNFSGLLVNKFAQYFPQKCLNLVVEYGTHNHQIMIEAIIKDRWNRYHSEISDRSQREFLLNWYSPTHPYWRKQVIAQSLDLITKMFPAS